MSTTTVLSTESDTGLLAPFPSWTQLAVFLASSTSFVLLSGEYLLVGELSYILPMISPRPLVVVSPSATLLDAQIEIDDPSRYRFL